MISYYSSVVELRSLNHVNAGPIPDSFVYIEGQDMQFICNSTPSGRVDWLVELTGASTGSGAASLAGAQNRIITNVTVNSQNLSDITVLIDNANLTDSETSITCKFGDNDTLRDVITIYVEGEYHVVSHWYLGFYNLRLPRFCMIESCIIYFKL